LKSGGGDTRPLSKDESMEELHRDPTVGPHPKVWTADLKNRFAGFV